ncbi:ATP-binding protein [Paenibacillus sp. 1P07SE]|uniref:ATP-binding protein n=1 Tax=Paenibacillus sp. 1P07SE TaxID=3132209 RepID=UPI0039A47E19
MDKLSSYYRKSITRRFMSFMMLALLLILCGAVFVLWSTVNIIQDYEQKSDEVRKKQDLVSEVANHANQIILRTRGYYVYQTEFEYNQIFSEKLELDASLAGVKEHTLSDSEQELMRNIEDFFTSFFNDVLPQGIEYANVGNYEALRSFISAEADNPVNDLLLFSRDFEKKVQEIASEENRKLINQLTVQGGIFLGYILLILILSIFITRRIATDIGHPLGQLSNQASRFAYGEMIQVDYVKREDEIGGLSRAFNDMMQQIQSKEEELLSQNEELQAQQDELQAQQEELQSALEQMERNEQYLEKRNMLVQSLSNTLNKQELLQSVIHHVVTITGFEKGLIVMNNPQHDYAAIGVSASGAAQFIRTLEDGLVMRASQTKEPYQITRACSESEQGYHEQKLYASELVIPILNADDEMVACMMLTKLGQSIDKQEQAEIVGMARQVSLAFDKLSLYESSERQRQMTSDMINTIQEGVQLLDLDGRTLQINKKISEFFRFLKPMGEQMELPLAAFLDQLATNVVDPEPLKDFIMERVKDEHCHETNWLNYEIIEPNRRYIQIYCEPLYREGVKFGTLLVHRDITKEYEVDRMKSEFVSTVSHELRTPLASVLGFAELLLHRELKPERQRKYVSTIHQEARRLTTLINDFLDLQRMESGKQTYDMKPISLTSLIKDVIELQRIGASNHEIVWESDSRQMIMLADQDKMQQVFTNLLSNAIKYSPGGGRIMIQTQILPGQLVIRISDEGLGIPDNALPKLFNKFYRVDNSDRREIGGTGLGLAIVKEIITRHKGTIEVESKLGEGSTFTIRFPVQETQSRIEDAGEAAETLSETSIKVMLIENDYNLSIMLRDELQASGFRVHLYTQGQKALEDIESLQPDIVVIDLLLEPDTSGWHVIEQMKKSESLQNTPIIISSAFEEKEKAAQWGISHFLVKPYLPGRLTATIHQMLRRS